MRTLITMAPRTLNIMSNNRKKFQIIYIAILKKKLMELFGDLWSDLPSQVDLPCKDERAHDWIYDHRRRTKGCDKNWPSLLDDKSLNMVCNSNDTKPWIFFSNRWQESLYYMRQRERRKWWRKEKKHVTTL